MSEQLVTFKGTLARAVYITDSFSVYAMNVDTSKYNVKINKFNNVSICGELPSLTKGVEYEVIASEEIGKYGVSYRVSNIRRDEPLTKQGVRSFLEEIVSPNIAYALVNAYPDIIERVKNNNLDDIDLSKMHGVGPKNFRKIVDKITENFYLSDLASQYHGILTMSMLKKIYDAYGSSDLLRERLIKAPYTTLTRISGIGFRTADDKILTMQEEGIVDFGFDIKTSADRCLSCVRYVLDENESEGHTKMDVRELYKQVDDMVHSCIDKFAKAIDDDSIYYDSSTKDVAIKRTHNMEDDIAKTIVSNVKSNRIWSCDIEKYRKIDDVELSDEQLKTLDNLCKNNICILNGAGGSGKSFSTRAIINMLEDMGKTYRLFAPTGKASKVLKDFTNRPASTIHRGLGYNPSQGWTLNRYNPIMSDVVIVDEMSMVDVELFWHLIDAIDFSCTKLLMIGDDSQLPSVGCGNLLHDFMMTNVIPTVSLTKIFRYGEGGLMKVATDIRLGRNYLNSTMKNFATSFGKNDDYVFIDVPQEKSTAVVVASYKNALEKGYGVDDIQVITPKNVSNYGTEKLNPLLQKIANPNCGKTQGFQIGERVYYVGDLVIECVNNYDAPMAYENDVTAFVANGETGTIKSIEGDSVVIDFDGIAVRYNKEMMNMVKLGYAITCHKSQGSSINYVILLTPQSDIYTLNSNLLYVGCTRAKNRCVHIGSVDTINKVIKKRANFARHTFMQQMLKSYVENMNKSNDK